MATFSEKQCFIVAGASSGIGRAIALLLNASGASVIGLARQVELLESLKQEAAYPECMFTERVDLAADPASIPAYVAQLRTKSG